MTRPDRPLFALMMVVWPLVGANDVLAVEPGSDSATSRGGTYTGSTPSASTGPGHGTVQSSDRADCGELLFNSDSTYENGYAWRYGGIVPPDFGSFAEQYRGVGEVCSVILDLSSTGTQSGQSAKVFVWQDAEGEPGAVLDMRDITPGPVAFWPSVSRHVFTVSATPDDPWWVGFWGHWPGDVQGFFVGADLNGPGGLPFTKIAPGLGYPTGWQNVSVVWGPTQAVGIGAELIGDVGACCYPDGDCRISSFIGCSGEFLGNDISCTPNPCEQPPDGACCFSNGSCQFVDRFVCEDLGGNYLGDAIPCDPNPCPQPPEGACCFADGTCVFLDAFECATQEGAHMAGVPCDPNPCPQPPEGACCFADGSCVFLDAFECATQDGTHMVGAPCDPNPCPQPPLGACCLADSTCIQEDAFDCSDLGGNYQGPGVSCSPNPCNLGACCLADGSCVSTDVPGCHDLGGSYQGNAVPCTPNPCPQPPGGACCFGDQECQELTLFLCEKNGGLFMGEGVDCNEVLCPILCTPRVFARNAAPIDSRPAKSGGPGPNAGGTLIINFDPDLELSGIEQNYCELHDLEQCYDALTRVDRPVTVIFFVMAAFPEKSSPRLAGLTFGVNYPECIVLDAAGHCGNFELDDPTWPDSGTGVAVTWAEVQTAHIIPVYWFAGYVWAEQSARFEVVAHPTQGGYFADDDVPSTPDPIVDYGSLGFFTDGYLPCPDPRTGACCLSDGSCVITNEEECDGIGGLWNGASACDVNPCVPVLTIDSSWGAVKAHFR